MILPELRVLREDAQFLADLRPDEHILADMFIVKSMEALDVLRKVFEPAAAYADWEYLKRFEGSSFTFDVDTLSEPFPAPALILTGRFDNSTGYREGYQILDNYSRGTFAVLDRAGHALAIEQKTLFRSLASESLDRVEEFTLMNVKK